MGIVCEKLKNNRMAKLLAVLLTAVILMQLCPLVARADGLDVDNTYALRVTTGSADCDSIGFFSFNYTDTDGFRRKEYIFPEKAWSNKDTFDLAASVREPERRNLVKELTKYESVYWSGAEMLNKYSSDTFLIRPTREVASVDGIEIYGRGSDGSWECQGMWLYEVEKIYGLGMAGFYSNDYNVQFTGKQIAELSGTHAAMNWKADDIITVGQPGSDYEFIYETKEYDSRAQQEEYIIRMDMADVYGAGFEALATEVYHAKKGIKDCDIAELMALSIRYIDVYGDTIELNLPAITSMMGWMAESGFDMNTPIAGIAQQGEHIVFSVSLPGFSSFTDVRITTGNDEALEATGVTCRNWKYTHKQRVGKADDIALTGISLYDASNTEVKLGVEGAMLDIEFHGEPLYYYTAQSTAGEKVEHGEEHSIRLREYQKGARLTPKDTGDKYILMLESDDINIKDANGELYVEAKYVDLYGAEHRTGQLKVRDSIRDFYGYWPSSGEDFAYKLGIEPGGTLGVVIEANNVDYFTGINVSLRGESAADWQMSGISIYQIFGMGKRSAVWEDVSAGGLMSDRRYSREIDGEQLISLDETVLVQQDYPKDVTFTSDSTVTESDMDWSDMRYSMSYEQSLMDLGFTKSRETYTVEVQVADDVVTSGDNGDCGSKNQFYFQLIFQNGRSGYVLANQQLSADGFRTGVKESFIISTNQNYGDLVSVRIIPDDTASSSDVFDKLNIDTIRVRKHSSGGLTRQWTIENVGWIDIEFKEEGTAAAIVNKEGRTEAEIARDYNVNYSSYGITLMFCIATGQNNESDNGGMQQFRGNVKAKLEYYDGSGKLRSQDFDLVKLMYEYANKSTLEGDPVSDSYMFRGEHMDRFMVTLDDVKELSKITLYPTAVPEEGEAGMTWKIKGVSASLVTSSEGALQINTDGEYQRTNATQLLCSTTNSTIEVFCPKNSEQKVSMYFGESQTEIKIDEEGSTWVSAISREPVSINDTLNVFVYPDTEKGDSIDMYDLDLGVRYTDIGGAKIRASYDNMRKEDGEKPMFYALGIGASGMSTLNSLELEAERAGNSAALAMIDYAVVQQVRSGVVIDTYYLDFGGANAEYECSTEPSARRDNITEEQVVKIFFGDQTETGALLAENRDVAVSINYTDNNDPSGREYRSPYIYLTDQNIKSIRKNMVAEIVFSESNIGEITGITLAATGNLSANVQSACVGTYEISGIEQGAETANTIRTETGWYSFDIGGQAIGRDVETFHVTSSEYGVWGTVLPVTLEFKTSQNASGGDSGTTAPISADICYTDTDGALHNIFIEDIRDYVNGQSNQFAAGQTAKAQLLISNMEAIRWIDIQPYDDNASVVRWHLDELKVTVGDGDHKNVMTNSIGQWILEGEGYRVDLANITITITASAYSEQSGEITVRTATNDTLQIFAESGQTVTIETNVAGSDMSYTVNAELVAASGATMDVNRYVSREGSTIRFTPPENTSDEVKIYRVKVSSQEVPGIYAAAEITVAPAPVVEELPEEPEVEEVPSEPETEDVPSEPTTEDTSSEDTPSEDTTPEETEQETEEGGTDTEEVPAVG